MRKTPSASCLVFCAFCVLSFFGSRAYGQERDRDNEQAKEHPNSIVQDWSHSHVLFPRVGEIHSLIAVQDDPRAQLSWQHSIREDWRRHNGRGHHDRDDHGAQSSLHTDWSISLGAGGLAKSMFPAKFTFDTTALPNCTTDFIVYTVNVTGSLTQPNIVAFNDLYSGTAPGPTGICNTLRQAYFTGTDTVSDAATYWSYNITTAAGGQVATSPALSLDGTKVAFVETGAGTTAHFHVLAWKAGSGLVPGDGVDAANAQNVLLPKTISTTVNNTLIVSLAPTTGSGTVTDIALTPASGTASDTFSSPFVDYVNDRAYIGNDGGTLIRVKNVFCTLACTPGVSPAPSLDTTWGGGTGSVATGCTGILTGPVVDGYTGDVFVGCADGKLYGFTSAGAPLTGSPLTVGNGLTDGGIVDPPLLDVVRGLIYVVSGNSGVGGPQVVVQAQVVGTILSTVATATLAPGGSFNLHKPAFNDNYFTSVTASTWRLYEVAGDSGASNIKFYGIQFTGAHVMTGGNPANVDSFSVGSGFEFSPVTEFLTTGGEDRLFESLLGGIGGNLASFRIDLGFPATLESSSSQGTGGTTGIVVDNDASASAQADSIYFGDLSGNNAVKLTQGALQ